MTSTVIFHFDEAPVVVLDGFTVAKAAGSAEITYGGGVVSITLEGDRKRTRVEYDAALQAFNGQGSRGRLAWEDAEIELKPGTELFETIRAWLERDEGGLVAEAIQLDAEDNHASRADTAADHRRGLAVA